MKEIVYVGDIKQDIDDLVAIEYLYNQGVLKGVVLDPIDGLDDLMKAIPNVKVFENLKEAEAKVVFCGGATTKIAEYLKENKLDLIVMNGGFVQQPLDEECLEKFKNKESVRTYNFNLNVDSTIQMLKSKNFNKLILVGKNVCHSYKNTIQHIHKGLNTQFKLKPHKRLHDLLMAQEGLRYMNNEERSCKYINGIPRYHEKNKSFTKWNTQESNSEKIEVAIKIK